MPVHLDVLHQIFELPVPRVLPHLQPVPPPSIPIEPQRLQRLDPIVRHVVPLEVVLVALVQNPHSKESGVVNGDIAVAVLLPKLPQLLEPPLPSVDRQSQPPQQLEPLRGQRGGAPPLRELVLLLLTGDPGAQRRVGGGNVAVAVLGLVRPQVSQLVVPPPDQDGLDGRGGERVGDAGQRRVGDGNDELAPRILRLPRLELGEDVVERYRRGTMGLGVALLLGGRGVLGGRRRE
mmetsp:Transcript_388/g.903  ORF Transcript_388/g.903 Transcript_388/m.903 type:complete len:234 (-) Transcript_388:313-1014(-)